MTLRPTQRVCAAPHARLWTARVVLAVLLTAASADAFAQTCSVAMQDVLFGNIDVTSGQPSDVNGSMTISCSGWSTPYIRICINLGWPDGGVDNRAMTGPASTRLRYEIYSDPGRTTAWYASYESGHRVVSPDVALSNGAGSVTVPYYARVFNGQSASPTGDYATFYSSGAENIKVYGYTTTPPACGTISDTATYPFYVRATVVPNCNVSASNIDFGQSGFIDSPVSATGLITSTCTKNSPYALALSAGTGAGATAAQRRMTRSGGSETLAYTLYRDSGRTQVWGDGTGGSGTVSNTGTGAVQTTTVYATLPVQNAPPAGSYVDTIIVTVTF